MRGGKESNAKDNKKRPHPLRRLLRIDPRNALHPLQIQQLLVPLLRHALRRRGRLLAPPQLRMGAFEVRLERQDEAALLLNFRFCHLEFLESSGDLRERCANTGSLRVLRTFVQ